MAVFDGQGKILDFTEIFGRRHRIYTFGTSNFYS